jgi:hypothetical protein
MPKVEQANLGN